jgi:hypothetical protein
MMFRFVMVIACAQLLLPGTAGQCHTVGDPIRLIWAEGDVAGMASIFGSKNREEIGFVQYRQTLHGNVLSAVRIAHFLDGSSDEDWADARVGKTLEALYGHSIIRDASGTPIVDITIDVAQSHVLGSWVAGGTRFTCDERVELPSATYWGPLIFILVKNFEANARDGRLVFRTVVPTPRPRIFDLELVSQGTAVIQRFGIPIDVVRFELRPTVHPLIDPLLRLFVPSGHFWIQGREPPALVRFAGPRNYAGQEIVIE